MPDLMSGQLASEGVALSPGVQPAITDVVVVVDRADVVARVPSAVPPGVVDGVDARVGPEPVAVGSLGVLPGHVDEPGQPPDFSLAHVRVGVDRAVLVVVVEPEQLAVVKPVLLPAGRRVSQLTLCLHQSSRLAGSCPAGVVNPSTRSYGRCAPSADGTADAEQPAGQAQLILRLGRGDIQQQSGGGGSRVVSARKPPQQPGDRYLSQALQVRSEERR